jgi:hypothetical protein
MKAPRRSGDGPAADEVPLDHIADLIGGVTTARVTFTAQVPRAGRAPRTVRHDGFWDYGRRLRAVSTTPRSRVIDHLQTGPDVLHRLSPQEQQETGRSWRWQSEAPPNWDTERAEIVATIRQRARPTAVAVEERAGERLRRCSLRIKPSAGEQDPLLAGAYDDFRRSGVRAADIDVWLTTDGRLRRTSERYTMLRSQAGRAGSITLDCWDFDLDLTGLAVPAAHEILDPRATQPQGVRILIDGEISPY